MGSHEYARTAEERLLLQQVEAFGAKNFSRENVKKWRRDQSLPNDVIKEFISMDFAGKGHSLLDMCTGKLGQSPSLHTFALAMEEVSHQAAATVPFTSDLLNVYFLGQHASGDLFERIVGEYERTGRLSVSFAASEPQAGSDSLNLSTVATTIDGRMVLNGHKTFVNNGEFSTLIMVVAVDGDAAPEKSGHPPLALFLVPFDLDGIRTYPIDKRGQRMLPFSDVVFTDVVVPEWCRLDKGGYSYKDFFHFFEWGRMLTCASSVGMAQAAMDDAVAYAFERETFGKKIGEHQQIQLLLVQMETKIQAMRNMLYHAADSIDSAAEDSRLSVALAKYYIPQAATEVASDALQIFGGVGYSEKERVYGIWEDCRGNQIMEGTDQIMVTIAAPLLKEKYLGS